MSAEKPNEKVETPGATVKDVVAKVDAKVEEIAKPVAEKLEAVKDAGTAMGVKVVDTAALTAKPEGTKMATKP